jgi:predicted MFS family arabinose efflux permease
MFALLAGANAPTPLYDLYFTEWHLSALELAAIFATYPLTLVGALWAVGRLSDRFGRRPVIVASLCAAALGSLLFAVANGPALLFAGRVAQALGVALLSGSASAALVELEPHGSTRRASVTATVMLTLGSGTAPLITGLLVEYAPEPTVLAFALHVSVVVPLIFMAWRIPETAPPEARDSWRPRRPSVPPNIRLPFAIASLAGGLAWLTAAILFSLIPSYLRVTLGVGNPAVVGIPAFLMLAVSTATQLAPTRLDDRGLMGCGLALGAIGTACLVAAVPFHSLVPVGIGAVLSGAGHGCSLKGSLATIARIAPIDARGELFSLHYAIVYLIVGLPIVAAGALVGGLGFFHAFAIFAGIVTLLASVTGLGLRFVPPAAVRS